MRENFCRALFTSLLFSFAHSITWPPNAELKDGDIFDFIIVGAGSSGSVLANRLTEVKQWRVLLLEAGGDPPYESLTPSLFSLLPNTEVDWNYTSVKDAFCSQGQKDTGVNMVPRGRMLGGCSSMNDMQYVRGVPGDYDSWAEQGFKLWSWKKVFPYFLKSEKFEAGEVFNNTDLKFHNTEGPMAVTQHKFGKHTEIMLDICLESLSEIGIRRLADFNGPQQLGASRDYFTHSNNPPGLRSSTASAFLSPITGRKNLFVLKHAFAYRLLFDAKTARGLLVKYKNISYTFYADKEIIISAGAINTPKLLIASGIGLKRDVNRFGIDVVSELPVGYGMQDHLQFPIMFTGQKHSNLTGAQIVLDSQPFPTIDSFISHDDNYTDSQIFTYYFNRQSPLVKLLFDKLNNYKDYIVTSIADVNKDYDIFVSNIVLLHPKSRGHVKITGISEKDDPEITTGYLTDRHDIVTLKRSIGRIVKLYDTRYFKSVNSSIVKVNLPECDHYEFLSDAYWECYMLQLSLTIYHNAGTCAMGKVVDQELNVYGVNKLRVIDASVMPSMPSGNTNAPVIMIGERSSDLIKNKYLKY